MTGVDPGLNQIASNDDRGEDLTYRILMTVPRGLQESSTFPDADLATLLELEQIEPDIFRANLVFEDQWHLYGGQVAAQALMAAGRTVAEERRPHSLHGYFLRPGDASI
ncbi:MAG: acyl-CoA thioesterase, partial [Pseudonocardiaceae bacterium]